MATDTPSRLPDLLIVGDSHSTALAEGAAAHGLGDAGHSPVDHSHRGLRRDIPHGKTGAPGGEDQVRAQLVRAGDQLPHDLLPLIGHDSRMDHAPAILFQHPAKRGAAGIDALSQTAFITNRDDGSPEREC